METFGRNICILTKFCLNTAREAQERQAGERSTRTILILMQGGSQRAGDGAAGWCCLLVLPNLPAAQQGRAQRAEPFPCLPTRLEEKA